MFEFYFIFVSASSSTSSTKCWFQENFDYSDMYLAYIVHIAFLMLKVYGDVCGCKKIQT